MNPIGPIFQFLANLFGFAQQKDAQKNAPEVVKAATAADEASKVDRERRNVEARDTDAVRKGIS